jgi:nucleoside 2-deoxyribosyltransferase
MNIYFACSITGGRDDQAVYKQIVDALLDDDHHVPTALLAAPEVMRLEGIVDPVEVYQRDVHWIETCDLLVAEVSTPSHGVGYEIGYALGLGKQVLCLHRRAAKVSKMISGNRDPNLEVLAYDMPNEAVRLVRFFLEKVMG